MRNSIIRLTHALAVMFLMAIGIVQQASAGEIRYTLDLSGTELTIDSVVAPDGNTYTRIYTADCDFIGEPGEPMIPAKIINFLVPTYSNNFKVSIESKQENIHTSINNPIYPAQAPRPMADMHPDDFKGISGSLYYDALHSTVPRITREFFVNGSSHIVSVAVPIAGYDAYTHIVAGYDTLKLSFSYEDCSSSAMSIQPVFGPSSYLDQEISDIVVNPPVVKSNLSASDIATPFNKQKYYYILTPEIFKDYFDEYRAWKTQKGDKVVIKTVEEIIADHSYDNVTDKNGNVWVSVDKESHIRNWLKKEYEKVGTFYLLIVGDFRSGAPIRKLCTNKKNPPESINHPSYVPVDGYFADLNTTYNLVKYPNGYYSEYLYDYTPSYTINVGRLPIHNKRQLDNYFRKLLIYETDPGLGDAEYPDKLLLSQQYDSYNYPISHPYCEGTKILDSLTNINTHICLIDSLGLKIFADNRPTGKEVIDAMEQCGYASIQGHGTPLSIATSGIHRDSSVDYAWEDRYIQPVRATDPKLKGLRKEYKNSFDELRNYGKPSFIYSVACSSCPFDNLEENNYKTLDDYIMPTAFLFAGDFGGIAYIGYTRDSYFDSMYKPENKFSGILNRTGNLAYAFNNSPSTSKYMTFARSLIGDPELNIWMGSPDESSAKISIDNSEIRVSDNNLLGSSVVIFNGLESKQFRPGITINSIDIPMKEIQNMVSNDFAISIFRPQCLPLTYLFANGCTITSTSKRYFLSEGLINKTNLYSGNNFDIADNVHRGVNSSSNFGYTISDNGALHLTCTRFIKTDKYFKVASLGFLEINCFGPASFSADEILKNGKMNVKATEIELQSGFSVEKGGQLNLSIHHWDEGE